MPAKMREALGLDEGGDGVYGWNAPPCDESDAPPPYIPRNAFNRGAQKSLKQSQVLTIACLFHGTVRLWD